jgi:CheY-like chemotaxis protein
MPRVLVVDDQAHVRAAISVALKACGFDVVAADNGRAGLSELGKSPFDLAMVDIYMPGMDGVQLIKALRKHTPNLPIVAMSGVLYRDSGRTALDILPLSPEMAGVVALEKPFRPKDLLRVVESAMNSAAVAENVAENVA